MRIALVVPGGVGADGVHAVIPALISLIERLAARHTVLVVATEQAARPASYELRGARVVCLGGRPRGWSGRARVVLGVLSALRHFRPDVIHAIWVGPGSTAALAAGRVLGTPVVTSLGGGELVALPRIRYGGAQTWRGRLDARLALRLAAAVTGGSRYVLAPALARRPGAHWLPLGAERPAPDLAASGSAPAPIHGPARPLLRLLVVASVNRVKGPEVVLGAIARLRRRRDLEVLLDWIGEDTLAGRSAALARSLGLGDAVTFHGFRPHGVVLDRLDATDLLVQGSHHEAEGVAVLEAAIRGVPTVGTAVGLVAELAGLDPPAAVAVPVGDAAALATAIEALARDAARRTAIGERARTWALAHDADWTAASFESLYVEVRAGRASTGRRGPSAGG